MITAVTRFFKRIPKRAYHLEVLTRNFKLRNSDVVLPGIWNFLVDDRGVLQQ